MSKEQFLFPLWCGMDLPRVRGITLRYSLHDRIGKENKKSSPASVTYQRDKEEKIRRGRVLSN